MSKNKKLTSPSQDLKENFMQFGNGEIIWGFRGSELESDEVYFLLSRYERLFDYLMGQYFLVKIIENNPSLEEEFELQFKRLGSSGYCYIDGIDPKTFKNSFKHDQKGWIDLNLDLHKALAGVFNERYQAANQNISQLIKQMKK